MAEGAALAVLGGEAARAEAFARSSGRSWEVVCASGFGPELLRRTLCPVIALWCGRGIPPKEADVLLPWLDRGFEVAVGSRFVPGESIVQRPPDRVARAGGHGGRFTFRMLSERAFLSAGAIFFGLPVRDCVSGLLAARRPALERLAADGPEAGFEEVLARTIALKMRIKEVGVMWIPTGPRGGPHSSWNAALRSPTCHRRLRRILPGMRHSARRLVVGGDETEAWPARWRRVVRHARKRP